jgi:prevent-host-death family protein
MRSVNVSETREQLAQLLDAVEAGEEVTILRRDRAVARLVPVAKPSVPFLDRTRLREEVPRLTSTIERVVRDMREDERY